MAKDFWRWAYSDLLSNTNRGNLAEYIVASACHAVNRPREAWDAVDIRTDDGISIEVKSGSYIQRWHQEKPTRIVFNVPKTYAWDGEDGWTSTEQTRKAEVYVFAVLHHRDQASINPLDLSQWTFYVIATRALDKQVGSAKTISPSKLTAIGSRVGTYSELNELVHEAHRA